MTPQQRIDLIARYKDGYIEPWLAAFQAARASTAQLLDRMREEEWHRVGTHSESGAYSTESWLRIYAAHAHDHAEQIRRNRRLYRDRQRSGV